MTNPEYEASVRQYIDHDFVSSIIERYELCSVRLHGPGVLSRVARMFALIRSRSSAVVASGEGCRLLCVYFSNSYALLKEREA